MFVRRGGNSIQSETVLCEFVFALCTSVHMQQHLQSSVLLSIWASTILRLNNVIVAIGLQIGKEAKACDLCVALACTVPFSHL
jgi:hypothetical protein